jgi:hypothetical protein
MRRLAPLSILVALAMAACGGFSSGIPEERPLLLGPRGAAATDTADGGDPAAVSASGTVSGDDASPLMPDAPAHAGGALVFADDTTVDIGELPVGTDFTLEAWVNPAAHATGDEMEILSKDVSGDPRDQFRLGVLQTGEVFFMASDDAGEAEALWAPSSGYGLRSAQPLPLATWSHVAITKTAGVLALLIDGQAVGTLAVNGSYTGGEHHFQVGARMPRAANSFLGTIDEVRIWSVGRTGDQILADQKRRIAPTHPAYASLVGSWRFDEMDGDSTNDDKGVRAGMLAGPSWISSTAF